MGLAHKEIQDVSSAISVLSERQVSLFQTAAAPAAPAACHLVGRSAERALLHPGLTISMQVTAGQQPAAAAACSSDGHPI